VEKGVGRIRKLFGTGGALALVILGIGQAPAHASLVDAQCVGTADSENVFTGDERFAQSFTAGRTGTIVQAQVAIDNTASGGNLLVQILPVSSPGLGGVGAPINFVLGSVTIPDVSVPAGATELNATFSPPVGVTGLGRYAVAVTRPGGDFNVLERSGNPCPGQEFFSTSQTDPWSPDDPAYDGLFRVIVNPTNEFSGDRQTKQLLHFTLPSQGLLELRDASAVQRGTARTAGKRVKLLKNVAQEAGPGGATIKLRLTKAGKQILREKGRLRTWPGVTFTPVGGDPKTKLVLVKFPPPK
jgi:hypothetical protein